MKLPEKGALPMQHIRKLMQEGQILYAKEEHIQPSSLDLSISEEIYRMRGSFLPCKQESIRDIIKEGTLFSTSLEHPLELNGIYLVRLNESLSLNQQIYGYTNNKSSSGRVNLQTRLLANGISQFDHIPLGYKGDIWLEIIPKSFPIKLSCGERLNQIRFFTGESKLSIEEHQKLQTQFHVLCDASGLPLAKNPLWKTTDGITMTIDLSSHEIVGYKCSPTTCRMLDYHKKNLEPEEFFEIIHKPKNGQLVMKRGEFYILNTKEYLRVPHQFTGEMVPYDPSHGEFRSHYAGFFDPGFGYGADGELSGTQAVLEIFTNDNDFILRDGQPICKMIYEYLTESPELSYGDPRLGNHYSHQQGPQLSKHFQRI